MELLISQKEFDNAKSEDLIKFKCSFCNKEGARTKGNVLLKIRKNSKTIFCSVKCSGLFKTKDQIPNPEVLKQVDMPLDEFLNSTKHQLINIKCANCNKSKLHPKNYIQTHIKNGKLMFCSVSCMNLYRKNGKMFECLYCDKEIYKSKAQIREKNFCSKECCNAYTYPESFNSIKSELIILIKENFTAKEIATKLSMPIKQIYRALNKLNLSTKQSSKTTKNLKNDYNWKEIQKFYNDGATQDEILKIFNISVYRIKIARKIGLFKIDTIRPHRKILFTPELKLKFSNARIKFLKEHPFYFKNLLAKFGGRFLSIPCEKFKEKLRSLNISFISELSPLLHKGRFFALDIAFPKKKIAIEINGKQHYEKDGTLKPYYQNRHDLIEKEGWIIYEVPSQEVFKKGFIRQFLKKIKIIY